MSKKRLDISTYEEWLIDYLDGTLSPTETDALTAFALANPDLEIELDELNDAVLSPPSLDFEAKQGLMRIDEELEQQVIAYVEDGDIGAELRSALNANEPTTAVLIEQYRSLRLRPQGTLDAVTKEELLYAEDLCLMPSAAIVYPDKADLKKKEGVVISMVFWRVAAAASILLVLGLSLWNPSGQDVPDSGVATTTERVVDDEDAAEENVHEVRPVSEELLMAETEEEVEPLLDSPLDGLPAATETVDEPNRPTQLHRQELVKMAPKRDLVAEAPAQDTLEESLPSVVESALEPDAIAEDREEIDVDQQPSAEPLIVTEEEDIALASDERPFDTAEPALDEPVQMNPTAEAKVPTVLEYLKEETVEEITGDRSKKLHVLDVLERVTAETDLVALNSDHDLPKTERRRFALRIGSVEFSRTTTQR